MTDPRQLVIVVDDAFELRDVLQMILEREGFRVITCADADQAFEAIQRERPALVLTDLMLGATSGLDLISRVRSDLSPPVPPIIACSGFERFAREARERGAEAFIPKPFELDTIIDAVHTVVAKRPIARAANDDASRRSRRLRVEAIDTARATLERLGPRLPDLTRRSDWTTDWLPAYLGFGQAFDALIRGTELRVNTSSDPRYWPPGRVIDDITLCRDILESASTLVLPNLVSLGAEVTRPDGGRVTFFAGVPLLAGRTPIGVLCLVDDQPHRLAQEEMALLHSLAQRASDVFGGSDTSDGAAWTPSGRISTHGLNVLLATELSRASRQGLMVGLFVMAGVAPTLPPLPPRTAIAELGDDRFALLMVRPDGPAGRRELVGTVRALALQPGYDAGGLLTMSGDAILPSEHHALEHAQSLCDRALRSGHGTIEQVTIRREPLGMGDTFHA